LLVADWNYLDRLLVDKRLDGSHHY